MAEESPPTVPDTKWGLNCGVFANRNPMAVTFKTIESKCENFHVKYQLYWQENRSLILSLYFLFCQTGFRNGPSLVVYPLFRPT